MDSPFPATSYDTVTVFPVRTTWVTFAFAFTSTPLLPSARTRSRTRSGSAYPIGCGSISRTVTFEPTSA